MGMVAGRAKIYHQTMKNNQRSSCVKSKEIKIVDDLLRERCVLHERTFLMRKNVLQRMSRGGAVLVILTKKNRHNFVNQKAMYSNHEWWHQRRIYTTMSQKL